MRYVYPAIRLALVIVAPIVVSAQGLSITNYQLISTQVVGTGEWDLTYSATLVNTGAALGSVSATLSSGNPFSFRVLGQANTLSFSPVPANSQVPSANTFIVLSSSTSLDLTQVEWTFQTTAAGPIANAGPNQTAAVGSTVTLNGSSSTTPSGVLSYSWKFASRPAGTSTILINATSIMPSFVVDVGGTYVVTLTVSNGSQTSTANVTISTTATAPVANAGPNQTVAVGATALLNGSGSSDVDGNPLTFSWTMTSRPTGSAAALVGATTVTPSFVVDKAGSYTVQLIVKDGSASSATSSVTITSENSPPVANAGAGQSVTVGSSVQLNGSGSTDTDGNTLTYLWSLITVPAGSAAKLSSTTVVNPTFKADLAGTYVAQLIVNDGIANSSPATVTITTIAILPPVANAGSNQTVSAGTVVSLNGSGTDPQNLQLTFHWSLTTLPANSKAVLSSATIASPSFSADLPGTYIAQLQVSNGTMNSNPATVTITATAPSGLQVPANTVIAPGQTLPLNVTLGSPAPSGGVFVSLASSNPSMATVAAAFIIPGGAMAPVTTPKVNGVALGSATITATASGYPPVTGTVQVTETLSFSPASLAISGLTKGQLFLFIPEAAPSAGVTVNVTSSNPGVATVPSTVVIGAGASNINVPVTVVSYGSTVITASGANIAATMANVTVSVPAVTGPPTIAEVSGTNQSTPVSAAFAAPLVVIVKDSNSNPISGATVSFSAPGSGASGAFAGGVTTASTNSSGIATSAAFSANGTTGSYYVSATVSGAVTPATFFLTNLVAAAGSTTTAPTGAAAPALVAHTSAASATGGTVISVPLNTSTCTPNCMLAVCYAASPSGLPSTPISDSLGNSWVQVASRNESNDVNASLWVALGAKTGAVQTVTATGGAPAISFMAFSGIASGPDQSNSSAGYGANPYATGAVVPKNNNELVISCAGMDGINFIGVNSPLTIIDAVPYSGGSNYALGSAYQVQTTASSVNGGWNQNTPVWTYGISAIIGSFYSTRSPATLTTATTSLAEGFVSTAYSFQLASSGGVCACTWTLTSGTLPAGLSLSPSGLISGTPKALVSATPLTFRVTDSASATASTSGLALTIAATSLSITTTSCPTGTQYQAYAGCVIAVTGGTGPYTFSYSTSSSYAALPEGLSLNPSTGAITSPQIGGQGAYGVDFIVTDSAGATASKIISFGLAGSNAFLTSIFPSNSIFHHRVDAASTGLPVDASPAAPIAAAYQSSTLKPFFGNASGGNTPNGIPALQVPYNQPNVPVTTTLYQSYFTSGPFPANAPVEATANCPSCDRHVLIYREAGGGNPASLWEMWQGAYSSTGAWTDSSNALWSNVSTNALTPQGTGTSDAAGLPVAPLLLNADEVIGTGTPTSPNGTVQHPTRFTLVHMLNNWVWPATQTAGISSCTGALTDSQISQSSPPASCSWSGPAGEIYRLKASVTAPACASASPQANIIITGMRNYGIILADNGISGGLIGTPDTRWNDSDLACLSRLTLSDFEPVNVSSLIVSNNSGQTLK